MPLTRACWEDNRTGGNHMWMKLNLSGITLRFRVREYQKSQKDDWDSNWCKTDCSFVAEPWLNYCQTGAEILLAYEVEKLANKMEELLTCGRVSSEVLQCIEPDFHFIFHPKEDLTTNPNILYVAPGCEIEDIHLEWKVLFWNGGQPTGNYLSVTLSRPDIEHFLIYLQWILGTRTIGDEEIQKRIARNIFFEDASMH